MKVEIKTWYDLKRFIIDELKGENLGQPVLIDDNESASIREVKEVEIDNIGNVTLITD
jgi:hypothetical protein